MGKDKKAATAETAAALLFLLGVALLAVGIGMMSIPGALIWLGIAALVMACMVAASQADNGREKRENGGTE